MAPVYPDDEQYESVFEELMADLYADAVVRLEEGESIDSILGSYPAQNSKALCSMLLVTDTLFALQHQPLPIRNPQRMARRREEFINQIALERSRQEVDMALPLGSGAALHSAANGARMAAPARDGLRPVLQPAGPGGGFAGALAEWWFSLQQSLTVGKFSLAPLVVTLALSLSFALGLSQVTNASLPGDLTYPIKAWVKMMNMTMSSGERRDEAAQQAADTIQADIAESARRAEAQAAAGTSLESVVHQESVFLVFDGYEGRLLKFGDIRVIPSYQANPNSPETTPIAITGDMQPGELVWLTLQILPGQADVVQGVSAVVQEPEPAEPDPTPIPCTPRRPAGWQYYTVQRGDTISELAQSSGSSTRAVAGANCLDSNLIIAGQMLFLPSVAQPTAVVAPTVETTAEPTNEPTVEPTAEITAVPGAETTADATPAPANEPPAEPTVEATAEPTVEATIDATAPVTVVITAPVTATTTMTETQP